MKGLKDFWIEGLKECVSYSTILTTIQQNLTDDMEFIVGGHQSSILTTESCGNMTDVGENLP
jgi:hypothetical protein